MYYFLTASGAAEYHLGFTLTIIQRMMWEEMEWVDLENPIPIL